mgnify:CR=1 FL=1
MQESSSRLESQGVLGIYGSEPGRSMDLDLLKAFRGEKPHRVPFWEVWYMMAGLTRHLLGEDADTPEKQVKLAKLLGWDAICGGGAGPDLPAASKVASDGTSHYVPGALTSLDQLHKPYPDPRHWLEPLQRRIAVAHDEGLAVWFILVWCFEGIATAMGLERLAFKCHDDIAFLHTAFEWVEDWNRLVIREVVIPSGVDFVLFSGDCAFKNGLMVHPKTFRELTCERTRATVQPLKARGIPYTLHCDGKIDDVAPMLIELGFSALHGIEAQANDLGEVKQRFGRDICLVGNMDVVFLTHATKDDVRRKTEQMLMVGSPGGRYVAACNTSPLDYIPYENYLAMVDVIRNFRC